MQPSRSAAFGEASAFPAVSPSSGDNTISNTSSTNTTTTTNTTNTTSMEHSAPVCAPGILSPVARSSPVLAAMAARAMPLMLPAAPAVATPADVGSSAVELGVSGGGGGGGVGSGGDALSETAGGPGDTIEAGRRPSSPIVPDRTTAAATTAAAAAAPSAVAAPTVRSGGGRKMEPGRLEGLCGEVRLQQATTCARWCS